MKIDIKKRTPGKWIAMFGRGEIMTEDGHHILARVTPRYGIMDNKAMLEELAANVKIIADAVNQHEDLVKACKRLLRAFSNYQNEYNPSHVIKRVVDWGEFNDDFIFARKVIAEAEKGGLIK